jgi:CYTH domain-containing protein
MDDIPHPDAPPGKAAKYAQRERERRFLVAQMPDLAPIRTTRLRDLYIEGTRLRLRQATDAGTTVFKLTQKIPAADGSPGLITTCYLNPAEYERFSSLPARVLEKTRYGVPPFGVDVFAPPLDGLILAEVELDQGGVWPSAAPPPFAVAEVTHDLRFTGGRLVATERVELLRTLAEFGIHPR